MNSDLFLLLMLTLHVWSAIKLSAENKAARPIGYGEYKPVGSSYASRTMLMSGLIVFAFIMIYASGFAGGGVIAGIQLGVLVEIAAIGMRMGFYAVQPIPGKLILYGSVSGIIEMIIVGAIVGAIYKPAVARMS